MPQTLGGAAASPAAGTRGRVFSGVQPSGLPHVGNHLGAFSNYIAMQEGYDAIYCIVDYHALTSTHDAELIRRNTHEMALGLLALGLDPDRAVLFRQSDRPEHVELMWLLASVTPTGWVERTPSFKEKRRSQPDDVNLALLSYPVLQAADIAIYKARYVPVGKDQAAHLELAREIVRAFNGRYGEVFPEPEAVFSEAPIVKGTDGVNKMSKSLGNVIEIFAPEEVIRRQVMSMVTDTQRILRTDPGRPEVCNVCQLHRIFSPDDYEVVWEGSRPLRRAEGPARHRRGGAPRRGRAAGAAGGSDPGRVPRAHGSRTPLSEWPSCHRRGGPKVGAPVRRGARARLRP
jgi:tryptophanyl-tRNA synthetase